MRECVTLGKLFYLISHFRDEQGMRECVTLGKLLYLISHFRDEQGMRECVTLGKLLYLTAHFTDTSLFNGHICYCRIFFAENNILSKTL